jgi:hypothetical protein
MGGSHQAKGPAILSQVLHLAIRPPGLGYGPSQLVKIPRSLATVHEIPDSSAFLRVFSQPITKSVKFPRIVSVLLNRTRSPTYRFTLPQNRCDPDEKSRARDSFTPAQNPLLYLGLSQTISDSRILP